MTVKGSFDSKYFVNVLPVSEITNQNGRIKIFKTFIDEKYHDYDFCLYEVEKEGFVWDVSAYPRCVRSRKIFDDSASLGFKPIFLRHDF